MRRETNGQLSISARSVFEIIRQYRDLAGTVVSRSNAECSIAVFEKIGRAESSEIAKNSTPDP